MSKFIDGVTGKELKPEDMQWLSDCLTRTSKIGLSAEAFAEYKSDLLAACLVEEFQTEQPKGKIRMTINLSHAMIRAVVEALRVDIKMNGTQNYAEGEGVDTPRSESVTNVDALDLFEQLEELESDPRGTLREG